MAIQLRPLQLPDDYAAIADLLNQIWSEPTSASKLQADDAKLYEVGKTSLNENGLLVGYDRERQVAIDEQGVIIGLVWSWRAPWTEPGYLNNTLVVDEAFRKQGVGHLLLQHLLEWAARIGASSLVSQVWDDHKEALRFADKRGFTVERHSYQSVLRLDSHSVKVQLNKDVLDLMQEAGIRFITLADEPEEIGEQKLYELYQETLADIPGFMGTVPSLGEWRKWYLKVDGYKPEHVVVATDGEQYVGVTNVLYNAATNGMYHEYTGVRRAFRGKRIALALKIKAVQMAMNAKASYLRTDNDSTNTPILAINRRLGYEPLRGLYRITASLEEAAKGLTIT